MLRSRTRATRSTLPASRARRETQIMSPDMLSPRPDRRCPLPASSRRGYTLIELLLIVAILGLAGSLLIPQLTDRDSMEVQGAARQIIADLSFAQADALAHQEYRRVYFYDDGSGYCLYRVTDGTFGDPFDADEVEYIFDPLADAGEQGYYIQRFGTKDRFELVNITDVDIDGGERFLTFDELGGTVSTSGAPGLGGSITVTGGDFSYRIDIAPFTGKLTVTKL